MSGLTVQFTVAGSVAASTAAVDAGPQIGRQLIDVVQPQRDLGGAHHVRVAGVVGLDHDVVHRVGAVIGERGRASDDAGNSGVLQVLVRNRRGHHVGGLRAGDQIVHRVRGRAALNVDGVILVELPGGHAELARAARHVRMRHRADHPRLGVERQDRGPEDQLARRLPLRDAGAAQLLAQPDADDPRRLRLGAGAGEVDVRFQEQRTRRAAQQRGAVDIVDGDRVVDELVVLVREVGGEVVERGLERGQLERVENDVPDGEGLHRRGVHAHADLELAERERVVPQAVHQHFLEPVAEGLLLLQRAAEFELRLAAGADERGHLLVADRRRVDGGLHVEERLREVQLRGGGVRAQPEPARPQQHVDGDPDRIHQRRAEDRATPGEVHTHPLMPIWT